MDKSLNNQNRRQNSSNDNAIVANLQIGQNQCECCLVCPWHRRWPPSDVAVQALRCLSTAFHLLQGWKWILEPELWSVFSHNIQNNHARFSPRLLLKKKKQFSKQVYIYSSFPFMMLSFQKCSHDFPQIPGKLYGGSLPTPALRISQATRSEMPSPCWISKVMLACGPHHIQTKQ